MAAMTDRAADIERPGVKSDRKFTLAQTTTVFSGTASGVIVLLYVIDCLNQGRFVTPTTEQIAGLAGLFGPFIHLVCKIIMYQTGRLLPPDQNT